MSKTQTHDHYMHRPENDAWSKGAPYSNKWPTQQSLACQGPNHHSGQPYFASDFAYMNWLTTYPTFYESFGIRSWNYSRAPPKEYGYPGKCAPGLETSCRRMGDRIQCTCARSGACGLCDFGFGTNGDQYMNMG
jgi:hypothetical protein